MSPPEPRRLLCPPVVVTAGKKPTLISHPSRSFFDHPTLQEDFGFSYGMYFQLVSPTVIQMSPCRPGRGGAGSSWAARAPGAAATAPLQHRGRVLLWGVHGGAGATSSTRCHLWIACCLYNGRELFCSGKQGHLRSFALMASWFVDGWGRDG